jgi:hypothetical protein
MLQIAEVFLFSALRVAFHHSNVNKSLPSALYRPAVSRQKSTAEVGMKLAFELTWRLPGYAQNKHTEEI